MLRPYILYACRVTRSHDLPHQINFVDLECSNKAHYGPVQPHGAEGNIEKHVFSYENTREDRPVSEDCHSSTSFSYKARFKGLEHRGRLHRVSVCIY